MFGLLCFLVVLVFQGAQAQEPDCIPDHVGNITLDWNYNLHWTESTNCAETHYLVYIHVDEDNLQYIFNTNDTFLDVNFLPACERFHFLIRAFSNHQLSDDSRLEAYIPAPSGTNLTIERFEVVDQEQGVLLDWEVNEKFAHCATAFRVVIRDDWYIPRDVYTQRTSMYLDTIVPCADYEFTVTAIYNQQSEGPIILRRYEAPEERAAPPVVEQIVTGSVSANITLNLPSYAVNRCSINAILVAGPFYSRTYEIQDTPSRPAVTVVVSPLQPDSLYLLNVYLVNSGGTSTALPIGVQTLPAA